MTKPSSRPIARGSLRGLAAAGFLACLALPAGAADKTINLKISLWVPPAHPLVQAAKDWVGSMEKASGGTIKGTIFPSEQLGKAFDHYDMVRDGIADVAYISPGYQPGLI
jgi:TRAP-type C4-dicarboxylate transport system substrate-binding protein